MTSATQKKKKKKKKKRADFATRELLGVGLQVVLYIYVVVPNRDLVFRVLE